MEQAKRMGAQRALALCQSFTGALEFQAGNWDAAERALRDSIARYREMGAASGESLSCQRLGVLLTARGQLDEALKVLEDGILVAQHATMRAHCLTRLHAALAYNRLEANDLVMAAEVLELGLQTSAQHGNCATCNALLLPAAVSVSIALGDLETVEALCEQLDVEAESYRSQVWVALSRQARGGLSAARGNHREALEYYAAAYDDFEAANYHYEAARCQAAMAELYRQLDATEEAMAASATANVIFEALGAPH